MTCRSKSVLLCVTILLVASTVRAQTDSKKEKEAAELKTKTLALLNEIASGAWGLKLPENRVFIMASTADLLWPFDEKRARNLYWEALNSINATGPKSGKPSSSADREKAYFVTLRLRRTVLRQVTRRDSQISLLLLLDRVVKSGAVKKSEIILDQAGIMPLDFLVFKYGKGVAALARSDFNRTRALADRFDRNELRLLAELLIVKGLLQPADVSQ